MHDLYYRFILQEVKLCLKDNLQCALDMLKLFVELCEYPAVTVFLCSFPHDIIGHGYIMFFLFWNNLFRSK